MLSPSLVRILIASAYLVGGYLLGIIFEKIVLIRLSRIAQKTEWAGDDIIIDSLKGSINPLFVIAGVYFAVLSLPLEQKTTQLAEPVLTAAAIIIGTFIASKITVGFVRLYSNSLSQVLPSSSIFTNIARIAVITCGVLIALQTLGISITPIITALGVGGLAVALAFQDTLSNLFSGLQILISQQMKPGDYVRLEDGLEGIVEDITWRNTTIKSLDNNLIIVPNNKLASSVITNYNKPLQKLTIVIEVGLSYDADLSHVEKVILDVAATILKTVPGGIADFQPLVRFHTFGASSIDASIVLGVKEFADQKIVRHEFIKALHQRFKQEHIDIPYPIQTVLVKK